MLHLDKFCQEGTIINFDSYDLSMRIQFIDGFLQDTLTQFVITAPDKKLENSSKNVFVWQRDPDNLA